MNLSTFCHNLQNRPRAVKLQLNGGGGDHVKGKSDSVVNN